MTTLIQFAGAFATIIGIIVLGHFVYTTSKHPAKMIMSAPRAEWTINQRIYVGFAGLALAIAGFGASKSLLYWLPGSIGHMENGEWVSLKSSLGIFGSLVAIWVGSKLYDFGDTTIKMRFWKKQAEELEKMLSFTLPNLRYAVDQFEMKSKDPSVAPEHREAYLQLCQIAQKRISALEAIEGQG